YWIIGTVGTFRRLYVNSISNGWLSFSKRGGVDDPCCYSKKFDSLKSWNNHFFWIDASVCPLSIPWFSGTFVVKDPLPVDEAVDLPCVELLNENHTIIRKYPEVFLCLVGLSRSFTGSDVRPTLLHSNDEEMGLLDFVNFADPSKVKNGERTLAENEVSLLTENGDRKMVAFESGSPLVKKARTEGIIISDSRPSTVGKSLIAHRGLLDRVTRPPSGCFVVLSSTAADTDIPASSKVVTPVSSAPADVSVPVIDSASDARGSSAAGLGVGTLFTTPSQGSSADDFYESHTVDSTIALNMYVPNWNITNNARIDNPATCRSLLDHFTPP
nr:putative transposase (putative), gypsy type [Tanacetum cinerariifolium]